MNIQSITAFEMSTSVPQTKTKMAKTPVVAPAAAAASVEAKTPKTKVTKAAAPAAAAVVVVPAVDAAPQETLTADSRLTAVQETLKTLTSDVSSRLRSVVHELQEVAKAMKREQRESKRRRKVDPETLNPEERAAWELRRSKNAFLKMRPLSDELCAFMGLPSKSQKSQTDVTKFISVYVKSHSCFDPTFKRRILPDAKLAKLLRVTDKNEVTYLNLQSFLKVHFLKTA
jgi:chromatin remodeling complex protein RSC6